MISVLSGFSYSFARATQPNPADMCTVVSYCDAWYNHYFSSLADPVRLTGRWNPVTDSIHFAKAAWEASSTVLRRSCGDGGGGGGEMDEQLNYLRRFKSEQRATGLEGLKVSACGRHLMCTLPRIVSLVYSSTYVQLRVWFRPEWVKLQANGPLAES